MIRNFKREIFEYQRIRRSLVGGGDDESFKYFYKNYLPPNHDRKVKRKVKDFISFDHTILSGKCLLRNQDLAHFLIILQISMQLNLSSKF